MSGYTEAIILDQGVEGSAPLLVKPFSMQQLYERIEEVLDGPSAANEPLHGRRVCRRATWDGQVPAPPDCLSSGSLGEAEAASPPSRMVRISGQAGSAD